MNEKLIYHSTETALNVSFFNKEKVISTTYKSYIPNMQVKYVLELNFRHESESRGGGIS